MSAEGTPKTAPATTQVAAKAPDAGVVSRTSVKGPTPKNPNVKPSYHAGQGLNVQRMGNNILVAIDDKVVTLRFEDWVKTIAATCGVGTSPEGRTAIEFTLNATQDGLTALAARANEISQGYGKPQG